MIKFSKNSRFTNSSLWMITWQKKGIRYVCVLNYVMILISCVYRVEICLKHDKLPVPSHWNCIADINNFLIVFNSSINCLIYCAVGKRFRFTLKNMTRRVIVKCFMWKYKLLCLCQNVLERLQSYLPKYMKIALKTNSLSKHFPAL